MTISSSLSAGVAGLAANASRLASISDNIANASTYGYKRVVTDFQAMVTGSQGGSYTAGGVTSSTQRLVDERGALISTTNATDLAVRGRGMLPVARVAEVNAGSPQMLLTSTGSFRTDADGVLTTSSGLALMGWPALPDGTIPGYPRDTADGLRPVRIDTNALSGEPTTRIGLGVNLPATDTEAAASGDARDVTVEYYDPLGKSAKLDISFVPAVPASGASNQWRMVIADSASGGATIGDYVLTFDDTRGAGGSLRDVTGGAYDADSGTVVVTVAGGPIELSIGGITQLSDRFSPASITKDGTPVGNMTGVEVDANGFVHAFFDNGASRTVFKVPLVDVPNPNGMAALDNQTFAPTPGSGAFFLWDAGDGPTGEIAGFAREESATDVAGELTAMIQTQRAYSSSAKVIQTVDEMLQETTNIKR